MKRSLFIVTFLVLLFGFTMYAQNIGLFANVPFKVEKDLQVSHMTAEEALALFIERGGNFHSIPSLDKEIEKQITIYPGDAVYPICSGGFCRSQTLWAILLPFSDKITLFAPHAARLGWDPYNGQINRYKNYDKETIHDEFNLYFGMEKAERFGFENVPDWKPIELSPSAEGLESLTEFYNRHYFGAESLPKEQRGNRRIYIAFSQNAHVTLYRLLQANSDLEGVTVVAIESEDVVSNPPSFLKTFKRSTKAYEYLHQLLLPTLDLSALE